MTRRILTQYVLLALIWGSSFFFVSVGLQGLSPAQVVLARLVFGAVTLAIVCAVTRQRLPKEPVVWGHLAVVGMLLCVIPFLLFAWAQQYLPSSIASILNATTPLMTMLVAIVALPSERPTRTRVTGLLVGFAGVFVVLAPWTGFDGTGELAGYLACLGATLSYGVAFVYLRRFVSPRGLAAIPVATVQVGCAAAVMLLLAPFIATDPVEPTLPVVLSMLALGALGTGLAYVWNTNIVIHWGATAASTVTYLTPIVGVALGTLLLGERIGWYQPVGAAVAIAGILISQGMLRRAARRGGRGPGAGRRRGVRGRR